MTTDRGVRLISWNTKGMNNVTKIGKVLTHLQHLIGDIMFLQETHLKTSNNCRIKRAWMGHLFHSKLSEKARGAAIIIHRRVLFEPTNTIFDSNGRFVIVSGMLQNTPVVLASIYVPNRDDEQFSIHFFSKIPNTDSYHIIIGGDFNLVQDPTLTVLPPHNLINLNLLMY